MKKIVTQETDNLIIALVSWGELSPGHQLIADV